MSVSPRSLLRVVAASAMTLGLLAGTTALASAQEPQEDDRATQYQGNVDAGQKGACERVGLTGQPLDKSYLTVEDGEETDKYLDVLEIGQGVSLTGIVVKGGDGYNVYLPADLGALAWEDLRAPLNGGKQIPTISHWFACGTKKTTTPPATTATTATTQPPQTSTTTETTTSGTEPTSTEPTESTTTSSGAVTTTTEAAVSPAGDSGDLAATGFSGGWLVGLGGALLVGGGALLALTRARRGKA